MRADGEQHDAGLLTGLMELATGEQAAVWTDAELSSIWLHQLAAPLAFDLAMAPAPPGSQATVDLLRESGSINSFADLLNRPNPPPPLPLLECVKGFARRQRDEGDSGYPNPVAVALYYATIALAFVRLNSRISKMDDGRLSVGMEWIRQQSWLDPATRDLAAAALERLGLQTR